MVSSHAVAATARAPSGTRAPTVKAASCSMAVGRSGSEYLARALHGGLVDHAAVERRASSPLRHRPVVDLDHALRPRLVVARGKLLVNDGDLRRMDGVLGLEA